MTDDTEHNRERRAAGETPAGRDAAPGKPSEAITRLEATLADQQARLAALGAGREETMRALARARAELARVSAERDQLREQLQRIDRMQTETLALPEDAVPEPAAALGVPTIEELMAGLSSVREHGGRRSDNAHLLAPADAAQDSPSQEMIAPELVFPEEYGGSTPAQPAPSRGTSKILVFLDAEQPIKYPLYKDVMTIGRAETADIRVDSDYVSRVHARIVATDSGFVVEDVDSKNGIHVNSKAVERQALRHGDVIGLGKLRFTFIDTAAGNPD